ncbi:MAG: D-alanine--D-alanine ligase [Clostridia bacterium]|nr:D-alanine--D-alanine ligase [Clostridia bacterium]
MSKTQVAVLFGGRSGEHEVSRNSAYTVANSLTYKYDVFPIGIAKDGQWYGPIPISKVPDFVPENFKESKVTILPNPHSNTAIYSLPEFKQIAKVDVFFPVLHGTFGEDGTLQGLFDLANIPYVGAGVLASSTGMDKVIMKNLFSQAELPQVPYQFYLRNDIENNIEKILEKIEQGIGYPNFVKPVNLGSSVGISKATNKRQLQEALLLAIRFDRKIIIEKGVEAREVEISVLGNDEPLASLPGEIVSCNEFYDYKAKYMDNKSALYIPARLEERQIKIIQDIAIKAFKAIDCSGLSRVDFFITKDTQEILINEINTLPGFTSISMYPKLWENSGISLPELTSKLVELALERYRELNKNVTSYE